MGNENSTTTIAVTPSEVKTIEIEQPATAEIQIQNPMQLLAIAVQNSFDIDRMSKVMDLYERWQKLEAEKAYNAAMAEFKKVAPTVYKDATVTFKTSDGTEVSYNHTTIGNLVEVTAPVLAIFGFRHRWKITRDEPTWIEVTCFLTHKDGHTESSPMGGAPDASGKKNLIQARASTRSYLERYTFQDVTGLATNENENDGKGGADQPGKESKKQTQQNPPAAVPDPLETLKAEGKKVIDSLKELQELNDGKYKEWQTWFANAKDLKTLSVAIDKLKAKLPPQEKSIADKIGEYLLQLSGNDVMKASKILKDAIIYYNINGGNGELPVISSRKQIPEDAAVAQKILQAISLYEKEVVNKKNGNGNGAPKAEAKPAVQQPAATIQKEVEAAI